MSYTFKLNFAYVFKKIGVGVFVFLKGMQIAKA